MSSTRHPFAYAQYVRYSQSTDTFAWRSPTQAPPVPTTPLKIPPLTPLKTQLLAPVPQNALPLSLTPPRPQPIRRSASQPPVSRLRSLVRREPKHETETDTEREREGRLEPQRGAEACARASPGHYVKHSSWVTVLLSGQEEGAVEPVYTNGATIEGILAVPRPAGLVGFEVKIEGSIKLKEVAGSGVYESPILSETVFAWDAEQSHSAFPAKVAFRYTLPATYTHAATGERFRLPPSYQAHLSGVPGFRVRVGYAIAVHITLSRSKMNWWRRGTRVRVPFIYRELSRPSLAGPFAPRPVKTPTSPRTVFTYTIEARRGPHDNIGVELYIPHAQVCSAREPLPFVVRLRAREDVLARYAACRACPESFHPLDSPSPDAPPSAQPQFFSCLTAALAPVRVQVFRRTTVDVLAACLADDPLTERTDLSANKAIASGVVLDARREYDAVVWSGTIVVPEKVRCGGFTAKGVKVTDSLVLNLIHPSSLRANYPEFVERVPIRLTTETYDGGSGVVTVSDMSDS